MQCRICLGTNAPETMVSPCACRGSIAYIHQRCLHTEQQYRREEYERTGVVRCTICRHPYDLHVLDVYRANYLPDLTMSSFLQLCVFTIYLAQIDANEHAKAAVFMSILLNIVLSMMWIRIPLQYSLPQHLLIHTTTLTFLLKHTFPVHAWHVFPWIVVGWSILYHCAHVVRFMRQEELEFVSYFCIHTLVWVEYILIILAFQESSANTDLTILFTTTFTNVCLWGYSAIRVYVHM